jgi:hypothetical protein
MIGYVGKSGSRDVIRLYLNLNFDEYVDIPRESILHASSVSEDVIEGGGTMLWIKKEQKITHVRVESTTTEAEFLKGSIAEDYLRPSEIKPFQGGPGRGSWLYPCLPSRYIYCYPSETIICRTKPIICYPSIIGYACPSTLVAICPTRYKPLCQFEACRLNSRFIGCLGGSRIIPGDKDWVVSPEVQQEADTIG